jgi:hypothetical protein
MFKIGDLVRIIKQPKDHMIHDLLGKRGYVDDINDNFIMFHELTADGRGGAGGIPIDCIGLANNDQELISWKKEYDDDCEAYRKEGEARAERHRKLKEKYIKQACDETGVSMEIVAQIFELAQKYQDDWERNLGW